MTAPAVAPAHSRARRVGAWGLVVAVILGVGVLGGALAGVGDWVERAPLDPDSPGPTGARAVARTLSTHGVDVSIARSMADAAAPGGTLVVGDTGPLSDAQVATLADNASDVVFVQPGARDARVLLEAAPAGYGPADAVSPDCDLVDAERAGPVAVGALFDRGSASDACYPVDGGYGLLLRDGPDGRVVVVDGETLFANEHVAEDGNAALAVNLLGRTGTVVWYVPSLDDAAPGEAATLGELTPPWVTPAIVLLVAAAAAAALWRGRRFGPLVTERLPVTVRAGETTHGRAQLYARSADTGHAANLLRAGARRRLSRRLGLGGASSDVVAAAVAARLGRDDTEVRHLLDGAAPTSDTDLVRLAAAVDELEAAVAASGKGES
jgi:hypothetical protein